MKIYLDQNVFDAALARFRWIFSEFENIVVNISGGKDSTVVLNLALMVAEEMGRLPLKVMFTDQEAEWDATIDYVRRALADPRIEPYWLQVPIKLFNATSPFDPWLYCWEEGKAWIRDKEPNSIHENIYGTDRFAELFNAFMTHHFGGQKAVQIAGVRAEESPGRFQGLTVAPTYKGATWGSRTGKRSPDHYTLYPIYDWTYIDVWKAIHDHGWAYCRLYDYMYQYGVPAMQMRVSNVHHETAVKSLFFLQEIEPDTWERVTARLSGINTAGQLREQFFKPKVLPFMFKDWVEYRDHLLENLVPDPEIRERMRSQFAAHDKRYRGAAFDRLVRTEIACILTGDYHGTKLHTFTAAHARHSTGRGKRNGRTA